VHDVRGVEKLDVGVIGDASAEFFVSTIVAGLYSKTFKSSFTVIVKVPVTEPAELFAVTV
jgi:hypothetical protein